MQIYQKKAAISLYPETAAKFILLFIPLRSNLVQYHIATQHP